MTAPVETRPQGAPAAPLVGWAGVLAATFSGIIGSNVLGIRDLFWEPATPADLFKRFFELTK